MAALGTHLRELPDTRESYAAAWLVRRPACPGSRGLRGNPARRLEDPIKTLDGRETRLDGAITQLAKTLRGTALTLDSAGYEAARAIWNGMIDRRPALIVQCAGVSDGRAAVDLAREHSLLVAVRGGGHNIAGAGTCEGGMVIDLSPMRSVDNLLAADVVTAKGDLSTRCSGPARGTTGSHTISRSCPMARSPRSSTTPGNCPCRSARSSWRTWAGR
jgi:hypothetical protein